MNRNIQLVLIACATLSQGRMLSLWAQDSKPVTIAPATMPRIGTVDQRFQSYNI